MADERLVITAPGPQGASASRVAPISGTQGAVCLTWDDGNATDMTVLQEANKRGQRHTFAITSSFLDTANQLTTEQVQQIANAGHEIASHSVDHSNMLDLSVSERVAQYEDSKAALEGIIGAPVTTWVYPFGTNVAKSPTTDQELYLRYDRIFTTSRSYITGTDARRNAILGRYQWQPTTGSHQGLLSLIRHAASNPVIVVVYAHDLDTSAGPTTTQLVEALDLCQSLGVPCLTTAEAFPPNTLLPGGGFEDTALPGWTVASQSTGTAESVVDTPDTGLAGTRSLLLTSPSDTDQVQVDSIIMPVDPNRSYTLSGRARTDTPTPPSGGLIQLIAREFPYDATDFSFPTHKTGINTTGWGRHETTFTTGPSTQYVMATAFVFNATAQAWYDHLWFGPADSGNLG